MRNPKRSQAVTESNTLTLANMRASFEHLLQELTHYKQQFEVEKNIKNNLYAFVLQNYGFAKLKEYEQKTNMRSPDGHLKALQCLAFALPENAN